VRRDFIFILSLAVRSTKTQAIPNDPTTEKERRDKGKRRDNGKRERERRERDDGEDFIGGYCA
jgi:hypothetical protein